MATLAFNGQLDFNAAFGWIFIQIHNFLNDVAENPDGYRERDPADPTRPYPDPDTDRTHKYLDLLRSDIIALTPPDGEKYVDPTPMQSMLRQSVGVALSPTDNLAWQVNDNAKPFFAIFDLLGIFLSIMGPAPTTSETAPTAQNFFLPLVALHAKWCNTLIGGGSGLAPVVAQVTWARQDDTNPWFFFLGSSAKGWFQTKTKAQKPVQIAWQVLAQKTRYSYMSDSGLFDPEYVWGTSPTYADEGTTGGWNFGNCGETYPLLYLINGGMPVDNIFGIAINVAATSTCGVDWTKYWLLNDAGNPVNMKPPCPNCAHVIARFDAVIANFELYKN